MNKNEMFLHIQYRSKLRGHCTLLCSRNTRICVLAYSYEQTEYTYDLPVCAFVIHCPRFPSLTLCCRTKAEKVILKRRPTGIKHYRLSMMIDDAVVRALASLYCGPGSDPGPEVTCTRGLSLLLVLVLTKGIFTGSFGLPSFTKTNALNSNSTWRQWTRRATKQNVYY